MGRGRRAVLTRVEVLGFDAFSGHGGTRGGGGATVVENKVTDCATREEILEFVL